jgi:hypothetical protein
MGCGASTGSAELVHPVIGAAVSNDVLQNHLTHQGSYYSFFVSNRFSEVLTIFFRQHHCSITIRKLGERG